MFTTEPFGGNPLAVFPEARGIDDATMQRIASEVNLSETVFVQPPVDERALRRLRIFTPGMELPLAGHPVVGTWHVLSTLGVVLPPAEGTGTTRIFQELQVGTLPVSIDFEAGQPVRVAMTQPRPTVSDPFSLSTEAAPALGISRGDIDTSRLPIVSVSAGSPCLAVALASRDALSRCRPSRTALDALTEQTGTLCVYAVYLESPTKVHARMFGGSRLGITEDPATGGAAGPLGGAHGPPQRHRSCVIEDGAAIESIEVAGPSVIVARGTMSW